MCAALCVALCVAQCVAKKLQGSPEPQQTSSGGGGERRGATGVEVPVEQIR